MYIHAASASKRTVVTHRDESLIPVFLAMPAILIPSVNSHADEIPSRVPHSKFRVLREF